MHHATDHRFSADGRPDDAPDVSVIVPLYNEQHTLEELFQRVAAVTAASGLTVEVIFVDDGSDDASAAVLAHMAASDRRARAVSLRRNFGKAAALAVGMKAARGRFLVTMDADLQDDPQEIPALVAKLEEGFDVVSGWKKVRHDPLSRRLASKTFNAVTRRLSRVHLHDFNCGLKAYSRPCAEELVHYCYGELHRYLPVLAHWRGHRVTELVVNHRPRLHGRSRYGIERYVRGILDLITVLSLARYDRRTMHALGGLGMALMLPGLALLGGLGASRLLFGGAAGSAMLVDLGVLLALGGLQLVVLGAVTELLTGPRMVEPPIAAATDWPGGISHPATPRPAPSRPAHTHANHLVGVSTGGWLPPVPPAQRGPAELDRADGRLPPR